MAAVYEAEIPLPSKVNRRVPKQVDAVVMRALERNRDKRYQSAVDLIRELSLAAGSTAWSKERCAEMVKERFADRLRDMTRLLERVPRDLGSSTDQHASLGERTDGPTQMVQRPTAPPPPQSLLQIEPPVRTMIESGPAVAELRDRARRIAAEREQREQQERQQAPQPTDESPQLPSKVPPMPVEPKASRMRLDAVTSQPKNTPLPQQKPLTPAPQPARPSTPPPQASLSEEQLFGDLDPGHDRTAVLSRRGQEIQNVATDPARNAAGRREQSSNLPIVIAALLALVLGAGGGVFLYSRMSQQVVQPAGLGRLSLKSDRPVTVVLMGQALGKTPLESWVPAGTHQLVLKEDDGSSRPFSVTVVTGQVADLTVELDKLPRTP
jgi:hypothetical protein